MKSVQVQVVVVRRRGRPRLPSPNYRLECMVPKAVFDKLVQEEKETNVYRTRVAAGVLTEWAATKTNSFYGHA